MTRLSPSRLMASAKTKMWNNSKCIWKQFTMLGNSFKSKAQSVVNQFLEEPHSPHQEEDTAKSVEKRQKMAKYARISRFSMRWVIIDDLQLTPYKKQSVQLFSESSKLKDLDREQVDFKGNGASCQQHLHLDRQEDLFGGGCDQ